MKVDFCVVVLRVRCFFIGVDFNFDEEENLEIRVNNYCKYWDFNFDVVVGLIFVSHFKRIRFKFPNN